MANERVGKWQTLLSAAAALRFAVRRLVFSVPHFGEPHNVYIRDYADTCDSCGGRSGLELEESQQVQST